MKITGTRKALAAALIISATCIAASEAASVQIFAGDANTGDWFGVSLARGGDEVIIGARQDDQKATDAGAAYVFRKTSGVWSQTAKLMAADGVAGNNFGTSISISGNRAAISAPAYATPGPGAVYIWEKANAAAPWTEVKKIEITQPTTREQAHTWISLDGDRLLISDEQDSEIAVHSGASYIFDRDNAGEWIQSAKLKSETPELEAQFGTYNLLRGDTAFVATPQNNGSLGTDSGKVEIFERQLDGSWTRAQTITASDAAANALFGSAVASVGNRLLVGAPGADSGAGAVYYFNKQSGSYVESGKISADDSAPNSAFGADISLSGNSMLVSAKTKQVSTFAGAGAAYLFNLSPTNDWIEAQKIANPEPAVNDQFARYLNLTGNEGVFGAFLDNEAANDAGSAYIYDGLPIAQPANLVTNSIEQNAQGVVEISFTLTPHDPPPANGYAIRVLALPSSQDCDTTAGVPDNQFDDITEFVTGALTLPQIGGSGNLNWDIRGMELGAIRSKYYVANGKALFRIYADPVN